MIEPGTSIGSPSGPRLAITCGLPRSGKSTLADLMRREHGWVRVCPDKVRTALHGQAFQPRAEGFVWATTLVAVRALLATDHSVVVDATNTTRHRRRQWVELAAEFEIPCEAIVIEPDVPTVLARNRECERQVPPNVIERMTEAWEAPDPDEEPGLTVVPPEAASWALRYIANRWERFREEEQG